MKCSAPKALKTMDGEEMKFSALKAMDGKEMKFSALNALKAMKNKEMKFSALKAKEDKEMKCSALKTKDGKEIFSALKVDDGKEMKFSALKAKDGKEIFSALKVDDGKEMKFSALKATDGEEMKFSTMLNDIYKSVDSGTAKSIELAMELIKSQSDPMTGEWREHALKLLITSAFEHMQLASEQAESFRDKLEKQIEAANSEQGQVQSDLHEKDDEIQEMRSQIDKMTIEKHKLQTSLDELKDSYKMHQGDGGLNATRTNESPFFTFIGSGFGKFFGSPKAVAEAGGVACAASTDPWAENYQTKQSQDALKQMGMALENKIIDLKKNIDRNESYLQDLQQLIIQRKNIISKLEEKGMFLRGLLNGTQKLYQNIQRCCTILNYLSATPSSHILDSFPALCSRLYDLQNCLTLPKEDLPGDLMIGYKNETVSKTVHYKLLLSVGLGHEENVCYILKMSERGLVSEKSLTEALKISINLRSRNITNMLLQFASKLLKEKEWSGQIQDVWPAYQEMSEWVPMFVVIYRQRYSHEKQHEYLGYEIAWRQYDFVSQEASIVATSDIVKDNPLSYDEMKSMKELIRKANLFRHHRNISVVNACPCISRKGGQDIVLKKCIVIYTSVKGLIPFDEQPFPKSISGVPVDVREAYMRLGMIRIGRDQIRIGRDQTSTQELTHQSQYFPPRVSLSTSTPMDTSPPHRCVDEFTTNCMNTNLNSAQGLPNPGRKAGDFNEKLLMGTEIQLVGNDFRGTLGAFVRLRDGSIGALTCAHVMGVYNGICDEDVTKIVTQPSGSSAYPSLRSLAIGHLYKAAFDNDGRCDDVSIDAAIIKVKKRLPEGAEFIQTETQRLRSAGFEPAHPPCFQKGEIIKFDQLRQFRRRQVIKIGSQSGLTQGVISMWGADVRVVGRQMKLPNMKDVEFFNQIEISSVTQCTKFFEAGDSGSLVFMPRENGPELDCVGLAVGWTSYDSCIVTPIENVFEKLGLPTEFINFSTISSVWSNSYR